MLEGKVWMFGDDINTDLIAPTPYIYMPRQGPGETRLRGEPAGLGRRDEGRRLHRRRPQLRHGLEPTGADGAQRAVGRLRARRIRSMRCSSATA